MPEALHKPPMSPWESKSHHGHRRRSPHWWGVCPILAINGQLSGTTSSSKGRAGASMTEGTQLGRAAALETTVRGMRRRECPPSPGMWEDTPSPSSKPWGRTQVSGATISLGCIEPTATQRSPDRGLKPAPPHPHPPLKPQASSALQSCPCSLFCSEKPSQEPGAPQKAHCPPTPSPEAACSFLATAERGKIINRLFHYPPELCPIAHPERLQIPGTV